MARASERRESVHRLFTDAHSDAHQTIPELRGEVLEEDVRNVRG